MLQWNIKQMLAAKGIATPYAWLRKQGIAHELAHKLSNGTQQRVDIVAINKVCTAAWCTPNDLFAWQPASNAPLPDKHPLHKLKVRAISQLSDKLKKLTPEQIAELDRMAGEMGG